MIDGRIEFHRLRPFERVGAFAAESAQMAGRGRVQTLPLVRLRENYRLAACVLIETLFSRQRQISTKENTDTEAVMPINNKIIQDDS